MKFYITTPIYYPNDIPHIGHAYTTIAGDILSRWNKLLGNDVFYLTGTDEHGKKLEKAAEKHNKTPKEFVDSLIPEFKDAWKKLNIKYDNFIRTTDPKHEAVVKEILKKVHDKGDIYLGEYEGYYCTGCEAYFTEKDLENGCCPTHKTKIEMLKEKSYFFKLSKYQDKLLELYNKNPNFILPKTRSNEVINRVKEGLNDLSISRTSFNWGIEIPFDKEHITFVWFDALLNYISGIDYPKEKFKRYWPADLHLVGKDILWFHAVIWPAMLMSAGLKLPKTIFAHGWWTFNKEKISKSRGKIINIDELINIAGVDSARYFLFRETPFGDDGDFSKEALIQRNNSELADSLGNLLNRVVAMCEKYFDSKIPISKEDKNLSKNLDFRKINNYMKDYDLHNALLEIFSFVNECNKYINDKEPWNLAKTDKKELEKVLFNLSESLRIISQLLYPFIPSTSEKINEQLGFKLRDKFNLKWGNEKSKGIKRGETLFKKYV